MSLLKTMLVSILILSNLLTIILHLAHLKDALRRRPPLLIEQVFTIIICLLNLLF